MAAIGRQALTVLLPVRAGREPSLHAALSKLGPTLTARLQGAETLHFARVVVVPGDEVEGRRSLSCLLLETTYDGALGRHVAELHAVAGAELGALLAACDGVAPSGTLDAFDATLRRGMRPPRAFGALNAELGVAEIRRDAAVRERVATLLEQERTSLMVLSPVEILVAVRGALGVTGATAPRTGPHAASRSPEDGLIALATTLPLVVALWIHDIRERVLGLWHDQSDALQHPALGARVTGSRSPQRAFTHMVRARPGRFRRGALRRALELAGAALSEGLARAPGIHAARFVVLDDGRLLFTHQQEGSLTSRLALLGWQAKALLSLVWSNTEGFPRALVRHLFGKTDDDRWLEWLRAHELTPGFVYSAYPTLTARDLAENAEVHALLGAEPTEARARRLLELM